MRPNPARAVLVAPPAPGTLDPMRIGIVGAGFAGLSAAKVLGRFGHDVRLFERCPDVGGVWSAMRRYPGLRVQNVRSTYAFSDHPWPVDVPEWPTGEQVQAYLATYVERFGLAERLRLGTEVVEAELDETAGTWTLQITDVESGACATQVFDHLVVANGVFCEPLVPDFAGAEEHAAVGGRVLHTTRLRSLDEARDRDVVVVGYGKSACDVAEAVSEVAASTAVVARRLRWKMPRRVAGVVNYKYLLLTRLGEALFRHPESRRPQRLLHGRHVRLASRMLGAVEAIARRQDRLHDLGLLPPGRFGELANSTGSLTTDRFFAKVRHGRIVVHRDAQIARLLADGGRALAELTDGARVPAELVLCGTGYDQRVPFLSERLPAAPHRRARRLRALPPHPAARRPASHVRGLQLVVLQPAQHGNRRAVDREPPDGRDPAAARGGDARARARAPALDASPHGRQARQRGEHYPLLDAQHRRVARRHRPRHLARPPPAAVAAADRPACLPIHREAAARAPCGAGGAGGCARRRGRLAAS